MGTVRDGRLSSDTVNLTHEILNYILLDWYNSHIVHDEVVWDSAVCGEAGGHGAVAAEAQHGADHLGVEVVPAVVTINRIVSDIASLSILNLPDGPSIVENIALVLVRASNQLNDAARRHGCAVTVTSSSC